MTAEFNSPADAEARLAFIARIEKIITMDDVTKLEVSLDRLHSLGFFTDDELLQLDKMICKKIDAIYAQK